MAGSAPTAGPGIAPGAHAEAAREVLALRNLVAVYRHLSGLAVQDADLAAVTRLISEQTDATVAVVSPTRDILTAAAPGQTGERAAQDVRDLVVHPRLGEVLAAARRAALRAFTVAEKVTKGGAFGCRMCGQCTLPVTGYACPATCPKQLRNGPCGGVGVDGSCEVFPDMRCVWVVAYERAEREGRVADLLLLQRPVDHRRSGQSAWVSYWRGDDETLWAPPGARQASAVSEGRQ